MKELLTLLLFVIPIFLEGVLVSIPLTIGVLVVLYVVLRRNSIFIAMLYGLLLDIFLLRQLGVTTLFFVLFIGVLGLYERKFEIASYQFVLFATAGGATGYCLLFLHSYIFIRTVSAVLFALLLFFVIKRIYKKRFVTKHIEPIFD